MTINFYIINFFVYSFYILIFIYIYILYIYIYIYIYIYTHIDILFDFLAASSDIYHEILRTAFFTSECQCFFICQDNCGYVKTTALISIENWCQDMFKNNLQQFLVCSNIPSIFKHCIKQNTLWEFRNLLFENE